MEIRPEKICFVLLPGFAPDAYPVMALKDTIEKHGYSAIASSFFGNESVKNFSKLTADNCIDNISAIIEEASKKHDMVFGIGISLGGAILLECAKKKDNMAGIVSIGTPFRLRHRKMLKMGQRIAPALHPFWKHFQKFRKLRLIPIGAGNMAIKYLEGKFLENLDRIKTPVLFLHSKEDDVTDFKALYEFAPKLKSASQKITFFENGNHVIDYNPELIVGYALDCFDLARAEKMTDSEMPTAEMELCPEKITEPIR